MADMKKFYDDLIIINLYPAELKVIINFMVLFQKLSEIELFGANNFLFRIYQ